MPPRDGDGLPRHYILRDASPGPGVVHWFSWTVLRSISLIPLVVTYSAWPPYVVVCGYLVTTGRSPTLLSKNVGGGGALVGLCLSPSPGGVARTFSGETDC